MSAQASKALKSVVLHAGLPGCLIWRAATQRCTACRAGCGQCRPSLWSCICLPPLPGYSQAKVVKELGDYVCEVRRQCL